MAVQSFVRWNMDRLAVRWLAPTTKTTWRAGGTPAKQDSPLCILPGPHGSFGDEAMAAGIVELLGEDSVQFVAQGDGADWPTPGGVESFNGLHHRFLPFVSAQGRLQAAATGGTGHWRGHHQWGL